MTFHLNNFHENALLKFLLYNYYGMNFTGGGGIGILNPKVEAFLSTKENFRWEIEQLEIVRDEENKIIDTIKTIKFVSVQGLGIPHRGRSGTGGEGTIQVKFNEPKVFHLEAQNQHRKYWDNQTYIVPDSEMRIIDIETNNLGIPASNSWPGCTLGQLLDIAIYTP